MDEYLNQIICIDALELAHKIPDNSLNCIVTSPPYFGLRDYGVAGQIGLEQSPEAYIARLVELFRELRRALRDDGTLWLNIGDSYAGSGKGGNPDDSPYKGFVGNANREKAAMPRSGKLIHDGFKSKDLMMIPARVAIALQADGWYLRSDIIWHKPNPMPESVTDRPTKSHEYVFLLAKSERYYYDSEAISEPIKVLSGGVFNRESKHAALGNQSQGKSYRVSGNNNRNKRSVWTVNTQPFTDAHFAVFPPDLIEPMVLAGCPKGGVVYDPFMGSGTTAIVARALGRNFIGSELNPDYVAMAQDRLRLPFEAKKHKKKEAPLSDLPLFSHLKENE